MSDMFNTFILPELITIIVEYLDADVRVDDIISMNWDNNVFSSINVSYIMDIIKKYPNRICPYTFGKSPCFPIEILDNDNYYHDDDPLYFNCDVNVNPVIPLHILEERLLGPSGDFVWANPSIPILEWLGSKPINFDYLYNNPKSFELFGKSSIADDKLVEMPNAGYLLLEVLNRITDENHYISYDNITIFSNILTNPSLPFDKILSDYFSVVNTFVITKNVNFPLRYVDDPKYSKYNFRLYCKELLTYNSDINGLLKLFPGDNTKCLLSNPKYYSYCVMKRVKDHLNQV